MCSSINSFCNSVSSATGVAEVGDAAKTLLTEVQNMKTNMLPKTLSDVVYITENPIEEITSVNDIEGNVEPIVEVAGVRG